MMTMKRERGRERERERGREREKDGRDDSSLFGMGRRVGRVGR